MGNKVDVFVTVVDGWIKLRSLEVAVVGL